MGSSSPNRDEHKKISKTTTEFWLEECHIFEQKNDMCWKGDQVVGAISFLGHVKKTQLSPGKTVLQ